VIGAAGDHDVSVAILNGAEGITYCMSARGASRYGSVVWPFRVPLHRDNAGGDVGDEHRNEEWRDFAGAALAVDVVLLLEALETADAAADDDTDSVGVDAVRSVSESGIGHRLSRARDCVLGVLIGPLCFLPLHVVERVEPFHFRRKFHREIRCVELGDRCRARLSSDERLPGRRHIVADGGNGPHASDDDSSLH